MSHQGCQQDVESQDWDETETRPRRCTSGTVWVIDLVGFMFGQIYSLTQHIFSSNIGPNYKNSTHYCRRQYGSNFNSGDAVGPWAAEFGEITQNDSIYAVLGHSPISVQIESPYVTSYYWILTYIIISLTSSKASTSHISWMVCSVT